jgi:hypothetical protein
MNNIVRFSTAPTNIAEIKANIFSYHTKHRTEFSRDEAFVYEDDYFKVEMVGYKLNQVHRDILDIILYYGGKEFDGKLMDSRFVRTISLYKIKELLGHTGSNNIAWVEKKINEIQQTLIEVTNKKSHDQAKWKFAAIETARHSQKLKTYAVIIHPLYHAFFASHISLDYSHYLGNILGLKNGVTKAAVRYFLTHKEGHKINIDRLLKKIGVRGVDRNVRLQREILMRDLADIGEKFNLTMVKTTGDKRKKSDHTIVYKRLPEVKFYYPDEKNAEGIL